MTVSIAALELSCSLALAQTGGSSGGTLGGGSAPGAVSPGTGGSTVPPPGSTPPGGSFGPSQSLPNAFPTAPPDPFTTGRGSGTLQTPQDLTRRYNRQDLTRPGAINPQDLSGVGGGQIAPGVPSLVSPETR